MDKRRGEFRGEPNDGVHEGRQQQGMKDETREEKGDKTGNDREKR